MATGFPDYYRRMITAKPSIGSNQDIYVYSVDVTLDTGTNTTLDIVTVPAGKRFFLSSGSISCEASCIQEWDYIPLGITIMNRKYDMVDTIIDSDIGAAYFLGDETLQIKLYNNDTVARRITGALWGQIESLTA